MTINKDQSLAMAQADEMALTGKGVALHTTLEPMMIMFKGARAENKNPRIRLLHADDEIQLSLAREGSCNPGHLYVKINGDYQGKISPIGVFTPCGSTPDYLLPLLQRLMADPLHTVIEYGRLTGCCSFCGRTLTDPVSKRLGYGPICGGMWCFVRRPVYDESTPSLWDSIHQ